jgi:Arc/MetJ family transcription regulator
VSSRKTSIAIDEQLLEAARKALETKTVRETVEKALLEVVRARARRLEVAALTRMDGTDLADPKVMKGAWRR